ncbi:hypothetical protein ACFYPC_06855 [Streptomyces sp. NPDC005808]|uniref:hypothetical protein n=1 Tax=Streptomyces sp. NPDC005808 TaxID=3364734 RepID=UPI0036BB4DFD
MNSYATSRPVLTGIVALTATALLSDAVPAFGDTGAPSPDASVQAATVIERATGVSDLTAPHTRGGKLVANAGGTRVEMSATGSGKLTVTDSTGIQIAIGLPGSPLAFPQASSHGTVVYAQPKGSVDVAAQVREDGSVSALITMNNPTAPTEHSFLLDLPSGAHPVIDEDGSLIVVDTAGKLLGTFDEPWAKDANGQRIPTDYRLEGNELIQTIHVNESTTYPVVADPKWWDKTKYLGGGMVSDTWNSMKCGGALAAAFHPGTSSYKAIKTAGGVKKLVATLSGVNSKRGAASALGSGFTTLLGVKSIKKACFDGLK